jgi:hypothetical protein
VARKDTARKDTARKDTQLIFFAEVFQNTNFYSEKTVGYVNAPGLLLTDMDSRQMDQAPIISENRPLKDFECSIVVYK